MPTKPGGGTFRVIAGLHEEPNADGVVVRHTKDTGDFESPHDLDVLFANKFIRVSGEPTKRPQDLSEELDFGGGGKVMDKPHHRAVNAAAGHEEEDPDFEPAAVGDDGGPGAEETDAEPESPAALVKKVMAKPKAKVAKKSNK